MVSPRIDKRWDFTKSLYICKFQVNMVLGLKCSGLLKSLCYMRPDKMSSLKKSIKTHFINVRTVKKVIRERIKKKWQKREKKNAFYQREITQGVNDNI